MKLILFIVASALFTALAFADGPVERYRFSVADVQPFWRSSKMDGESVLFLQDAPNSRPRASLLFTPTKILSVKSSSGKIVYEEGRDFLWQPGHREILLPTTSRIVFKTPGELRRPPNSQRHVLTHRDGKGEILFGATHEYHDTQTAVSYLHDSDTWSGPRPSYVGGQLPRTIKILTQKKPLTIALFGDSISTGCNVSGWANVAPFQPPYQDLFKTNLKHVYGAPVSLKNLAVDGMATAWGLQQIDQVIRAEPDLVILAFGMNDSAGRSAEEYQANTLGMIDAVRKSLPETEFVLLATMLGNQDWTLLHHERFPQYRDALADLCGPGIVLADMTSMWQAMLKYKSNRDLTGNGVNHPNDFGHRVYAQVLSALLVPPTHDDLKMTP